MENYFCKNENKHYFCTPKPNGAIAQLVEQRTENPCVPGSIPGGTTFKRLQNWKIPEIQTFQGFFFSTKSHLFSKIRQFRRPNSWSFWGREKMTTNSTVSHWLSCC